MIGRSTIYKGIKMRSRLEADFAAEMDRRGLTWAYEPQCFADSTGQYLPDFAIYNEPGMSPVRYIEVKPEGWGNDDDYKVAALLRRMEIIWATDPTAALQLVWWQWHSDRPSANWFTFGSCANWTFWSPATGVMERV